MKKITFLIIFLSVALVLNAQEATLFGKITDTQGIALPGVAIMTSTGNGVISESDGNYQIELQPETYLVSFSYVGFKTQKQTVELKTGERKELNITLEEDVILLKTPTITASRFAQNLGEVTVSLEVIKPDLIENSNTIQVDEILTKVPSLTVVDGQANVRNGSGYSYGAGSRVLLLIDDLPALQGDAGFPNWNFVPVENIGQMEVLKGAASALYGSSAMNGIINIRSAYATEDPYTKVSFFGTTYGNPRDERMIWWSDTTAIPSIGGVSLAHRQKFGDFELVLGAYGVLDQSFRKDEFTNYGRVNINTRYKASENVYLGVNANVQLGNSASFILWQNDTTGALLPRDGTVTENNNNRIIIDPHLTINQGNSRHKFLSRFYSIKNEQSNATTDQSVNSQQIYGEYQFQHTTAQQLNITAGLVGSRTTVDAALYGDSIYNSSNAAIYGQLDKKLLEDKLNLSVGARFERNTIASPNTSVLEQRPVLRAGLSYKAGEATFLRASYGQGYRFPTIAEKYISTSLGTLNIYPNDTLRSETGWSAEIGIKQGFKIKEFQGYIDVAYYWMEYYDMMEFIFGLYGSTLNDFGFASLNIGNTRINGIDFSVATNGKIGEVETAILAGYTYSNPVYINFEEVDTLNNSSSENILKYRFRHTFKVDAYLTYKKFSFGWTTQTFSFMENIDRIFTQDFVVDGIARFRERNNGTTVVSNARVAYAFSEKLKVSFLVKNLMNAEYALRPSLMNAPRNFSLRIDYQLQ